MYILFEEHQYESSRVEKVLKDIYVLQDVDKRVSVQYVGYFYNPHLHDCVFILPKVLLTEQETLVGVKQKSGEPVTPEMVLEPKGQEKLNKEYRKFIYEFSVWIYRALNVFYKANPKSKAILYKHLPQAGKGRRHQAKTYLDIVLSLINFNQENRDFVLFTIKNLHRGNNKINWTRTISHSQAFVQDKDVVYLNPVNKKRIVNYEEELFVIFYSILNYLNDAYGFHAPINIQYELITGKLFKQYMQGMGKTRLMQIKYKYFSDKALQLWDLCYAFFENSYRIAINTNAQEYLLAKKFNVVFEAMIDDLIGEKDIPKGLKEQDDGKRVDHMYTYYGLTNSNDQKDEIYYIGDSKYYKANHQLGKESLYKQYTYARNVIQWNIDLFVNQDQSGWTDEEKRGYEEDKNKYKSIRLRDDVKDALTEGYNIIPNFFISAFVDEKRNYIKEENIVPHEQNQTHIAFQFKDRLFDRDTLILSHYDVNFLYVLYLYARNKSSEKDAWKKEVRKIFRDEIRKVLQNKFVFFAMKSKGNVSAGEQFIKDNFKELQGKLLRPYADKAIYTLALEKRENENPKDSKTYNLLKDFFEFEELDSLGDNPKKILDEKVEQFQAQQSDFAVAKDWLPIYHLERYLNSKVLVGAYHGDDQLKWILKNHLYNIRLGKDRTGAQKESELRAIDAKFLILYEANNEFNNDYTIYKINGKGGRKFNSTMKELNYPREPKGDYYCYDLDEEVNIGQYNLNTIISRARIDRRISEEGELLIMSCEELIKYKL